MYQKRFIKINCLITLFTFLVSIFSANFAFVNTASAQENILNKITEGIWKVKTIKGEFDAAGTGGYEKWADGKQRFVLRDSLGHLMSWGEAKIDKLTGGQIKVTVKDNDGTFEAVKISAPALETVAAVKSAVMDSAPEAQAVAVKSAVAVEAAPTAVETAPKATIGQKLSALKTKITTPIENGGKGSTAWDKGYGFGKDAPSNIASKVKGIFSKGESSASVPAAGTTATVSAPVSATSAPAANASAPAVNAQVQQSAANAPAPVAVETAPKATIGQKLSALKTKITTPIETGGKGSTAWEKGYSFGKDTPTNAVNKVKGLFTKNSSSSSAVGSTTSAAGPDAPAPSDSAPVAASPAAASTTASGPNASTPAADASTVSTPVTDAAPKATLGQKLSALKTKVTTPIETGGKGSTAWEKGYKFGKETPGNAVNKVKSLFTKKSGAVETTEPAVKEAAASEPTPSQKMADQKNAKVEFDEKTGQFQKAAVPAAPSKISTALSAGKDSLKASFSVKNLGISAGLTVGFKLFEQVKNGEKISIGKAVGHLATGEFAGSFVGSGLGSAAGTVVGSLLGSSIPVVGPIIGALMPAIFGQVGGHLGASMGNDLASGQKPSFKKAIASIDKVAVLGQAVGSTIGAAIGSMLLPGIGTMIGGLAGSMIANIIINKVRNRAKSNYHVSGVNAQGGQVIYGEQLAPPPAQPVLSNMGTNASGDGQAQNTYERMINAYKLYSQMLSEGKGETPECQQALSEYKQLYTNYAGSVQGQNIR